MSRYRQYIPSLPLQQRECGTRCSLCKRIQEELAHFPRPLSSPKEYVCLLAVLIRSLVIRYKHYLLSTFTNALLNSMSLCLVVCLNQAQEQSILTNARVAVDDFTMAFLASVVLAGYFAMQHPTASQPVPSPVLKRLLAVLEPTGTYLSQ